MDLRVLKWGKGIVFTVCKVERECEIIRRNVFSNYQDHMFKRKKDRKKKREM